jgi:fermentation-respiration switch protein FrsA (DUF1100 family)
MMTDASVSWRVRWRRRIVRLVRSVVVIYLLVALVIALVQKRLIFPGAATHGTADSVISPTAGSELVQLKTAEGIPCVGLFFKVPLEGGATQPVGGARKLTLIYFYGNAMCLNDAQDDCRGFAALGVNVLGVEYPGYGMAGGTASEKNCYAAAEAAYQYVLTRPDVDVHRIVPTGWSLGGAVAMDLAARHGDDVERHICGVMTFSTFTSMADVGQYHYPFLPVSLLLTERFDSLGKVGKIRVPLLIGHGEKDEVAPFAMAGRLAAAAGGPVTRLTVAEAGHNDFFVVGEEAVKGAVGRFLAERAR